VSLALPAECASHPLSRNARQSRSRNTASSSTTRTTGASLTGSLAFDMMDYWKLQDRRAPAARSRLEGQAAPEPLRKEVGQKRSEPHSLARRLGCEKRLGNTVHDFRRHSHAPIANQEFQALVAR